MFHRRRPHPQLGRRTMSWIRRLLSVGVLLTASSAAQTGAHAIEVVKVEWGFDGTVRPGGFNPLTITLRNPDAEPFDEFLELERSVGMGGGGVPLVERVYLSPGAVRRIRFYPRVSSAFESWQLSWGKLLSHTLPRLEVGGEACVMILDDAESPVPAGFTRLESADFPLGVACTHGLGHVAFDRQPDLEPAQWQALADWVHTGGHLYLLRDESGAYPAVPDSLGSLAQGNLKRDWAAGTVLRLNKGRREFTLADLVSTPSAPRDPQADAEAYVYRDDHDQQIASALAALVTPKHSWPWIVTLTVLFMLLVAPVAWVLWRHTSSWWLPNAYLLALVTVFSLTFIFVGRRGYGESERLTALTYARPIGGKRFAVTQWINVFVTRGRDIEIRHGGAGALDLYASPSAATALPGAITNQQPGAFLTRAPLFSWRDVVHSGVCNGPEILADASAPPPNSTWVVRLAPDHPRIFRAWAINGRDVYTLRVLHDRLELDPRPESHALSQFGLQDDPYINTPLGSTPERLERLGKRLVTNGLRSPLHYASTSLEVAPRDDTIEIFVLTERPTSFAPKTQLPAEEGRVVYHYTCPGGPL